MRALIVILAIVAAGLIGAAVGTSLGPGPWFTPPAPGAAPTSTSSPSPQYQAYEDIKAGDCFDPIEDKDDGSLLAAVLAPCNQPHRMEAFGVLTHPAPDGAPYPGEEQLGSFADDNCADAFRGYVGTDIETSALSVGSFLPDARQWRGGDRHILCVVEVPPSATLNQSVKGSKQ